MTDVKIKSLLSKRITKEMLITRKSLQDIIKNYDITPAAEYSIEAPDNKKKYIDSDDGPLPERLIVHGDFILTLKDEVDE